MHQFFNLQLRFFILKNTFKKPKYLFFILEIKFIRPTVS
jgi:hypothetical protein